MNVSSKRKRKSIAALVNGGMKKEINVRDRWGAQALKWAVPRPDISIIWRSQAPKSAFFRGNARFQAGKTVLFTGTHFFSNELVSLNLVKIMV